MYSIAGYGSMIADQVRTDAFAQALRRAITPESVVVDLGTGTGIFALLACQYGARRVYAIEPSDAIQVAREIAAANGFGDRIDFIQAMSTAVTLPEQADVIVSDLGGVLPLFGTHIPSVIDARRRFLAPGGVLIPDRDTLWAAVVEAPSLYEDHMRPWDGRYGLDLSAARRLVANTWTKGWATPDQLLVVPQSWAVLDYRVIEAPNVRASTTWTVTRSGTGHGVAVGFDRILGEGVRLTNLPDAPRAVRPEHLYGTAFFPWCRPVPLVTGDAVTVDLQARLAGDDYGWAWQTQVKSANRPSSARVSFTQSTFFGTPLSAAKLRQQSARYIPRLTEDGRIAHLVLKAMHDDTPQPLEEIARHLSARFPTRFPTWREALTVVAELSRSYT